MKPSFEIEEMYESQEIFGIDEAGLGPLAGPLVVAACCIEHRELSDELLININDSKKLSRKKREYLFEILANTPNIKCGISVIDNETIDEAGLSNAWRMGVVSSLIKFNPKICIIDGKRRVEIPGCKVIPVVDGDQKSYTIAAASIIAKVTRDRIMMEIHEEFPEYGFDHHVGYGTRMHLDNLRRFGPCEYHRQSYVPIKNLSKHI